MKIIGRATKYIFIYALGFCLALVLLTAATYFKSTELLFQHLSTWQWLLLMLLLLILSSLAGFMVYRKVRSKACAQVLLQVFFAFIIIAPVLATIERGYYFTNSKPGFHDHYFHLYPYSPNFTSNNRFVADSLGINIANKDYFLQHEPEIVINDHGFRGRNIDESCDNGAKVLCLGDSFLWGLTADPITNSFADLLDQHYCIFNTGITGADPMHYKVIAEKYIPLVQPEITCLFLCAANDFLWYERELHPYTPVFYWNERFGIPSEAYVDCDSVLVFKDATESYNYLINEFTLYGKKSWLTRFLAKTSIGTHCYFWINDPYSGHCQDLEKKIVARGLILKVKELAEQHNSKFMLFFIPDKDLLVNSTEEAMKAYPGQLDGLEIYVPAGMHAGHFSPGLDVHFNNEGHRYFAKFVKEKVDSVLQANSTTSVHQGQ